MIKFEHTEVMGWEAAVRGMRNPMNSWGKSDSGLCEDFQCGYLSGKDGRPMCPAYISDECEKTGEYIIGPNDMDLMRRLAAGGPVHAKYRRMITVYVDITAPLYWWKEFDTYKVGTVANSCSTMHKIAAKEFTLEDFSHEHLRGQFGSSLKNTLITLNKARETYLETNDREDWWQMIQLLPSSYNQKRTVMLNYEVLAHIYKDRKYHKLDEWREHEPEWEFDTAEPWEFGFCDWIKTLPYPELICGEHINKEETTPDCFVPMPGDK